MLIIRLTRRGRRNDPSFRLVVSEKSDPIKGKFLEELGYYNPKLKTKAFKNERILHWIEKGAKCSPTVNNLLIDSGVIKGKKVKAWRPKSGSSGPEKKEGKGEESEPEAKAETVLKEAEKEKKAPEAESKPEEKKPELAIEKSNVPGNEDEETHAERPEGKQA